MPLPPACARSVTSAPPPPTTALQYFLWLMLRIWYFVLHTFDAGDLHRAADTVAKARALEAKLKAEQDRQAQRRRSEREASAGSRRRSRPAELPEARRHSLGGPDTLRSLRKREAVAKL